MEAYSQVYETPEILNEASAGEVFGRVVRGTGNALKDLPAATMAQLQGKGAVKANDEALARQQRRGQNLQTLVTTGRLPGQAPTSAAKPKLRNRLDDPIAGKGPKENEVGSKPALAPAAATTPPAAAAPATAPKPATAPAATTPPKQTIVLAKKDGVEGKLDKATGKFISGNFSDAEKARYAKFSKPTTPTSTNADKSTTPTNADKSTTPTNTDKSTTPTDTDKSTTPDGVRLTKINPEWAKAHPRLAEVERLRNQQRVAGKNPYDKEFRDKVINPVMYGYPNPKMPGSGRSVEDSKKMFPDTPKPAPTQTPAADAKPTPPAKPAPAQAPSGGAKPPTPKPVPAQKPGSPRGEDLFNHLDLFDLVKGHLLDEGYADTEESAMVIMVNMSEAWRESILESHGVELDEAQRARENPEEYERSESRRQSKRERAMNDPHTGINSPAFAEFMRQQMGGKKKKG